MFHNHDNFNAELVVEPSRRQRLSLLTVALTIALRRYLSTHNYELPPLKKLPRDDMTLRNALVTDCTVLRSADGTDNEQPYADITCLHPAGDTQCAVVVDSFAKLRPSVARDESYDELSTDSDDDADVEEDVDWSAQLEAVLVAPKKARTKQKNRQPVTGEPETARKRGRPKKAARLPIVVAPVAGDEDFVEPEIADELNRVADFVFADRMSNNDGDEIVDITL